MHNAFRLINLKTKLDAGSSTDIVTLLLLEVLASQESDASTKDENSVYLDSNIEVIES